MTHVEDRPQSGKGLALVGDCCRLPFGYIRDGKLVLRAPHVRSGHELSLSANDLRSPGEVTGRRAERLRPEKIERLRGQIRRRVM